ncbi:MAG: tetratricopeptide repeat protein [Lachnospiraceae bacterium]|nr:tetratricopeptide repeat protein [Lachnospiraceae bacterium]
MHKKKVAIAGMLVFLMLSVTGCNSNKSVENIKQGFDAITSLKYEEALRCFETADEAGENKQQIARGQGIAYLGLAKYKEAIEQFLVALSYSDEFVDNFDFDTNYYLATAYFKNGQVAEAEKVYTAILALRDDREARYLRGIVFLEENKLAAAKEDFDVALAKDNSDYDMRIEIAKALMNKGFENEAKAYLQAALGGNEKKISDYDKGRLSYYMGDYENARNYLESTKGNKSADAALLLGQTYEKLGDYNYAASVYSNYLTQHPDNVILFNRLGMCKLQAGDAQGALECFEKALAMEDSSMTQILKFNQIVAYEYLGEFDQANVLMRSYLQIYPDDQEALREYEFLRSR